MSKNHTAGTSKDGNRLNVQNDFIFNIDNPEAKIRKPPTMDISVINSAVRNGET